MFTTPVPALSVSVLMAGPRIDVRPAAVRVSPRESHRANAGFDDIDAAGDDRRDRKIDPARRCSQSDGEVVVGAAEAEMAAEN